MRGKYRMHHIVEVVILLLWMTGCRNVSPDSTNATEIGFRSAFLSPDSMGRFNNFADLVATGEAENNRFGVNVTFGNVNGDGYNDLLVTAPRYNDWQGKAYLYYGGENIDDKPDKIFTGEEIGDSFSSGGGPSAYLADINKDGFDDVIIGARKFYNSKGRVYIFYGGLNMDETADIIIEGHVKNSQFGHSIAVGDLNGDGELDIVIGANKFESYRGRAYLYYGPIASDTTVDKIFTGEATDDTFASSITARGDVDGDGCDDLLIGTLFWPKYTNRGRAYFYYGGSGTEMDVFPDIIFDAESGRDNFAVGLDLFDIDNDGYADILVSAREWGEGANASQGRAYIYWGSSRETMDNVADVTFTGEAFTNASFGGNTIYAGHVNSDPYGDIIIGAYNWHQRNRIGRAYLFYGGTRTSIDTKCDHIFHENKEPETNYGKEARLCDLNNDGLDDVVLAGYTYNNEQGRVWIYLNKPLSSK
jgi:hypothetical protein